MSKLKEIESDKSVNQSIEGVDFKANAQKEAHEWLAAKKQDQGSTKVDKYYVLCLGVLEKYRFMSFM